VPASDPLLPGLNGGLSRELDRVVGDFGLSSSKMALLREKKDDIERVRTPCSSHQCMHAMSIHVDFPMLQTIVYSLGVCFSAFFRRLPIKVLSDFAWCVTSAPHKTHYAVNSHSNMQQHISSFTAGVGILHVVFGVLC
jgi:hypothetical protein